MEVVLPSLTSPIDDFLASASPCLWPSHSLLLAAKRRLVYIYGRKKELGTEWHVRRSDNTTDCCIHPIKRASKRNSL